MSALTRSLSTPAHAEMTLSSNIDLHPSFLEPVRPRGTPIALLGVPFDNVTSQEAIDLIGCMVTSRLPHYLVTANVDFLVQAQHDVELRRILFDAHLVLCDGTPLLWASRWFGNPLPERVAGSDLVPLLVRTAARKGYRLFFLGGSPSATEQAVNRLQAQHPTVIIAGHYSPPFQDLLEMDHADITRRIRAARPDVLFVSFGCPKQEKWIAMHYRALGVPVAIGVGGTIDFLAGRLARAPFWMRRTGTEWLFRLAQEPRRLGKRYARDCWHFGLRLVAQWCRMHFRRRRRTALMSARHGPVDSTAAAQAISCPEWLDAKAVEHERPLWDHVLASGHHILLDLQDVEFIDSTGVGLLIRLRKSARLQHRELILVAPTPAVCRVLEGMRLWPFFRTAADMATAQVLLRELTSNPTVTFAPDALEQTSTLTWQGEVTAANADEVWRSTEAHLNSLTPGETLLLQLRNVTFVDSTGVGLMVRAKKLAAARSLSLTFANLQPSVQNVIHLSKLETYLLG